MHKLLPILSLYIITLSIFYSMGYWHEFNINFLEYINLNEVVMISLKSLAVFTIISIIVHLLVFIYLSDIFPEGEGKNTTEGKFLNAYWKFIYLIFLFLVGYSFYINNPLKMFIFAFVFAPLINILLINQGFLKDIISNNSLRSRIISLSVYLLFFSNPMGYIYAKEIKNTIFENQVLINKQQYTYIGKLGTNLFLYSNDNNRTIQINPIPKYLEYIPNRNN